MFNQSNRVAAPIFVKSTTASAVLRKTYFLLSLTLLFSACTAALAMHFQVKPAGIITLLIGMFGLSFLTTSLRNSPWGILAIFAFTGFMGYTLGPILNLYLHQFTNGPQLIFTSLGATGVVFIGLSAYTFVSRKDFSYLGGFIAIAAMAAFLGGIAAMLFHLPVLDILIACAFVLISSAYILFTTSQLINGGETNAIMATINLYVAIFNLFISLLRIFSYFAGNRD